MSDQTRIEWTDATWNPVTGCTKVSDGCLNCYAERMARRFGGSHGFDVRPHPERLSIPVHWRKPRMVFVCSMGDLFHKAVPRAFIEDVFDVMCRCPQHTFQVLTKRPERMANLAVPWPEKVWAGVTVESDEYADRVCVLQDVQAQVRFVSLEPLLGPVPSLRYDVDWVIVGGETGPGARPMRPEWVRAVRDNCRTARVPFFFKRWGTAAEREAVALLDGREWREYPAARRAK